VTGLARYREAERLAGQAQHFTYGDGGDPAVGAALAAEAQVHALLALTDAIRALAPAPALIDEQAARPAPAECCDAADLLALAQAEIDRLQMARACPRCCAPPGIGCVGLVSSMPRRPHRDRARGLELIADRDGCLWLACGDQAARVEVVTCDRADLESAWGPLRFAAWPGGKS